MIKTKQFSIKVTGSFDLINRDGKSVRPTGRKDCALLAMLALTRTHRQTRTWLQDKLWSDRGPAQGAASLRQALTSLRAILNCTGDALRADRTWVWLEPEYFDFDHLSGNSRGEVLRGFDLRDEGFNDWLREIRTAFDGTNVRWGPVDVPAQPDRRWHLESTEHELDDRSSGELADLVCDSLAEALSVVGVHAVVDRRNNPAAPEPRATDLIVRVRAVRFGHTCVLSVSASDGLGSLCWQVRRESNVRRWAELRAIQMEVAQLFQDFAVRTEAESLRGARWSAHANGCQALLGILVPGSISLHEIAKCCEAAIAADEKGIYHALLGCCHLRIYGEREEFAPHDADVVMQNFRTALQRSPTNGLVQALAGHSYGFFLRDLDRNADLTREAVRLLPGSGLCWNFHAISLVYCGQYAEAVDAATNAVSLCRGTMAEPRARSTELFARLMFGDTKGAIRAGERSILNDIYRPSIVDLMTAYACEGRADEGREKLELLRRREPDLCVDMLKSPSYPIVNSSHRAVVAKAAGQLGLA